MVELLALILSQLNCAFYEGHTFDFSKLLLVKT